MIILRELLGKIDKNTYIEIYEKRQCIADGYSDYLRDNFALQGKRVVGLNTSLEGILIMVKEND